MPNMFPSITETLIGRQEVLRRFAQLHSIHGTQSHEDNIQTSNSHKYRNFVHLHFMMASSSVRKTNKMHIFS